MRVALNSKPSMKFSSQLSYSLLFLRKNVKSVFFFVRFKSKESSYFKPICLKQEDHSPRCILQQFLLVILTSQILQCGWFLWLLTHHICSVAARVVRYSPVGLVCGVSWYSLNSYRGYYTVAQQHFTNERSEQQNIVFATRK